MNLKKAIAASIIIVILFGGLSSSTTAEENNAGTQDVNVLKTNIGELKKTIQTQEEQIQRTNKELDELKKQLDAQIKENDRLRELCKKAGIDTTKEIDSNTTPNGRIIYRGKERDEDWFNRMYKRFSDKIALVGDKFVDLGTEPKEIGNDFVEVGTIIDARYGDNTVISVIGDREALINYQGGRLSQISSITKVTYHICGYDYPLIDGQRLDILFKKNLICVGTYEYTTAQGAKKTIQSFKVWEPKPLTKEQFAEALRSGFELVNYVEKQGKTVKVPIR
ncbi:MAG: hypothetical protein ABSH16_03050 [Sedimentisphaerales bacterium]